jgi:RNA 2',3'-cyclic 3'-phosphodiesterase
LPRLFVAVWPPPALIVGLRGLDRPQRPGLRWTTEDQWHVTLRFLGQVDEAVEGPLRTGLAGMAAVAGPTAVEAGPAPRALGSGVWVLPVEGLGPLARSVAAATAGIGPEPTNRRFRGHVTLARARRPSALAGLDTPPMSERWTVREISLVCSELRPHGAEYEVVGRWRLGAG